MKKRIPLIGVIVASARACNGWVAQGGAVKMPFVRSRCAVAVSLWLLAHPSVAQADPIAISSGIILGNRPHRLGARPWTYKGPGSRSRDPVGGFLAKLASCTPCARPSWISGRRSTPGFSNGAITGVIEGITYPLVYVGFGSGTITTPTATLTELGESLVEVPFTFTAVMNGYLESPLDEAVRRAAHLHSGAHGQRQGIGALHRPQSRRTATSFSLGSDAVRVRAAAAGAGARDTVPRGWRDRRARGQAIWVAGRTEIAKKS